MTRRDPAATTRAALEDLTAAVATIDHALRYISDTRSGYPTSTPGAALAGAQGTQECPRRDCLLTRPCPLHDSEPGPDTVVERTAFTPDRAATDAETIAMLANRIARDTDHLRKLSNRWGLSGVDATEVLKQLHADIDGIYCKTCGDWGNPNTRAPGRIECRSCAEFRRKYNAPYSRKLADIRTRRGEPNSGDIDRDLTERYGPAWRQKLKKSKGRAA